MEFKCYSRVIPLSVLIILIAWDCSNANCSQGNDGEKKDGSRGSRKGNGAFLHVTSNKFLWGRKMLHLLQDENTSQISGKNKHVDIHNSSNPQNTPTISGDKTDVIQNEEALLAAEDEIESHMAMDYRMKPRRSPPINNQQPQN